MTAARLMHGKPVGALAGAPLLRALGAGLVVVSSLFLGGCAMQTGSDDGQSTAQELSGSQSPTQEIVVGGGQLSDDNGDGKSKGAPRMESGPGNGPDPLPWKQVVQAQEPGSGDGPDPLPWMHNANADTASVTTAK